MEELLQTKELIKEKMISFFKSSIPELERYASFPLLVSNNEIEKEFNLNKSRIPVGWIWIFDNYCLFYNQEEFYLLSQVPKAMKLETRRKFVEGSYPEYNDKINRCLEIVECLYWRNKMNTDNDTISGQGLALKIEECTFPELNDLLCEPVEFRQIRQRVFDYGENFSSTEEGCRQFNNFRCLHNNFFPHDHKDSLISCEVFWNNNNRLISKLLGKTGEEGIMLDITDVLFDNISHELKPVETFATQRFIENKWPDIKKLFSFQNENLDVWLYLYIEEVYPNGDAKIRFDALDDIK